MKPHLIRVGPTRFYKQPQEAIDSLQGTVICPTVVQMDPGRYGPLYVEGFSVEGRRGSYRNGSQSETEIPWSLVVRGDTRYLAGQTFVDGSSFITWQRTAQIKTGDPYGAILQQVAGCNVLEAACRRRLTCAFNATNNRTVITVTNYLMVNDAQFFITQAGVMPASQQPTFNLTSSTLGNQAVVVGDSVTFFISDPSLTSPIPLGSPKGSRWITTIVTTVAPGGKNTLEVAGEIRCGSPFTTMTIQPNVVLVGEVPREAVLSISADATVHGVRLEMPNGVSMGVEVGGGTTAHLHNVVVDGTSYPNGGSGFITPGPPLFGVNNYTVGGPGSLVGILGRAGSHIIANAPSASAGWAGALTVLGLGDAGDPNVGFAGAIHGLDMRFTAISNVVVIGTAFLQSSDLTVRAGVWFSRSIVNMQLMVAVAITGGALSFEGAECTATLGMDAMLIGGPVLSARYQANIALTVLFRAETAAVGVCMELGSQMNSLTGYAENVAVGAIVRNGASIVYNEGSGIRTRFTGMGVRVEQGSHFTYQLAAIVLSGTLFPLNSSQPVLVSADASSTVITGHRKLHGLPNWDFLPTGGQNSPVYPIHNGQNTFRNRFCYLIGRSVTSIADLHPNYDMFTLTAPVTSMTYGASACTGAQPQIITVGPTRQFITPQQAIDSLQNLVICPTIIDLDGPNRTASVVGQQTYTSYLLAEGYSSPSVFGPQRASAAPHAHYGLTIRGDRRVLAGHSWVNGLPANTLAPPVTSTSLADSSGAFAILGSFSTPTTPCNAVLTCIPDPTSTGVRVTIDNSCGGAPNLATGVLSALGAGLSQSLVVGDTVKIFDASQERSDALPSATRWVERNIITAPGNFTNQFVVAGPVNFNCSSPYSSLTILPSVRILRPAGGTGPVAAVAAPVALKGLHIPLSAAAAALELRHGSVGLLHNIVLDGSDYLFAQSSFDDGRLASAGLHVRPRAELIVSRLDSQSGTNGVLTFLGYGTAFQANRAGDQTGAQMRLDASGIASVQGQIFALGFRANFTQTSASNTALVAINAVGRLGIVTVANSNGRGLSLDNCQLEVGIFTAGNIGQYALAASGGSTVTSSNWFYARNVSTALCVEAGSGVVVRTLDAASVKYGAFLTGSSSLVHDRNPSASDSFSIAHTVKGVRVQRHSSVTFASVAPAVVGTGTAYSTDNSATSVLIDRNAAAGSLGELVEPLIIDGCANSVETNLITGLALHRTQNGVLLVENSIYKELSSYPAFLSQEEALALARAYIPPTDPPTEAPLAPEEETA
jgi:hypothetical protein